MTRIMSFLLLGIIFCSSSLSAKTETLMGFPAVQIANIFTSEPAEYKDMRMAWWREAKFGLFIHWGLYAVPAGQWKDKTTYGEWIRNEAQIPLEQYDLFAKDFNPVQFDAAKWVATAKAAGMKYIVITSKHHDGFCMFDTKLTDYNIVAATPFKRDPLKELSDECRKQNIKFCTYYSIMDWHHPDYMPRRGWEKRSAEGADFTKYVNTYLKDQLAEILTQYDPAVLWFDGEWENTWTEALGRDLYQYLRSLKPDIIINNRVGKGRAGMSGKFDPNQAVGDFGTPEQEIPATGLAYDWESCMTMNDHWGYNKSDKNYKSAQTLIRNLIDTASKGGNYLLNVGPTADGTFPIESMQRLETIGLWMQTNGDSVYGTTSGRFRDLPFGRSTTKKNRIYLHVFDWPKDGKIVIPGLTSTPNSATFLQNPNIPIGITQQDTDTVLIVPDAALDPSATVIELEFDQTPNILYAPQIFPQNAEFTKPIDITFSDFVADDSYRIYYTLDGKDPNTSSLYYEEPFTLRDTATITCRKITTDGKVLSPIGRKTYTKK
jgi:alpha-L-fucosidase